MLFTNDTVAYRALSFCDSCVSGQQAVVSDDVWPDPQNVYGLREGHQAGMFTWAWFVQHKDMLKSFRATSLDLDAAASAGKPAKARVSTFLPTSRRIVQFANGTPAPPGATVVYIDGGFDLFHLGHLEILKAAAKLGDYLLVGVHGDADVTARRGAHLPIMTVHERCLSVMACKHVDEVIIGTTPSTLMVIRVSHAVHIYAPLCILCFTLHTVP